MPVIPFKEVRGKTGAADPLQKGTRVVKVGGTRWVTVVVIVTCTAQTPAAGVKVYVPEVALLIVAGFHVPEIPLLEVAGNTGAVVPLQKGGGVVNTGVAGWLTTTVTDTGTAHAPAAGVKV